MKHGTEQSWSLLISFFYADLSRHEIAMENKDAEIAAARALLSPTPVNRGHVPRWFAKRWVRRFGEGRSCDIINDLCSFLNRIGAPCLLDHYGSTILDNGCFAFVTEPYFSRCDIEAAVAIVAGELKCDYSVEDKSWHYPGRTTRGAWFEGTDMTQPIKAIERLS